jgi:hypothetical protein
MVTLSLHCLSKGFFPRRTPPHKKASYPEYDTSNRRKVQAVFAIFCGQGGFFLDKRSRL